MENPFEKSINNKTKQYLTNLRENNPGIKYLYHYCNINTLIGIIEHHELWLGSKYGMNDKTEGVALAHRVLNFIKKECINRNERYDEIICLFDEMEDKMDNIYIFCMSTESDDAAQWDRYANNGQGICLRIDCNELAKLAAIITHGNCLPIISCIDYTYSGSKYYTDIFMDYINGGTMYKKENFNTVKDLVENLFITSSQFKHGSFSGEKEVRFIVFDNDKTNEDFFNSAGIIKKIYKLDLLTSYFDISIEIDKLFDGLIIGPCSKQNKKVIEEYLIKHQHNKLAKRISKSTSPLIR